MRRLVTAAFVTVVLASSGAASQAAESVVDSVDLQVAGNAAVKGTLRSAIERESFLLRLPAGATVSAAVKRRGKGALVPRLDFLDEGDQSSTPGATKGKGSTLKSPPLAESGDYRVRVFGDGVTDGDYSLKLGVKYLGRWRATGTAAPEGGEQTVTFGAPAGAVAQIKVVPAKGSAFVPELDTVDSPSFPGPDLSGSSVRNVVLGPAGTYVVRFHDAGTAGGGWNCEVRLKIPRVKKSTIDISASGLTGSFSADEPVFGREIGPEGGIVDPPDLGGALDGSSVDVPAGSLPFPVVITVHEADPFDLLDGNHAAGPAIDFGPTGTEFDPALAATVTIPFDASQFTDPETELHVYVLHDGVVTEVTPLSFPGPGLVSFPTTSFSTFVAARDGPRPLIGDWVLLSGVLQTEPDFGGLSDFAVGELQFGPNFFTYGGASNAVRWIRNYDDQVNPPGPHVEFLSFASPEEGSYFVVDDRSIYIERSQAPAFFAFRGEGGDVLVTAPTGEPSIAQFLLALRRARGVATPLNLAGDWGLHVVSLGAESASGGVELFQRSAVGTATFTAAGRVSYEMVSREARAAYPDGTWATSRETLRGGATIVTSGNLVFLTDDESGPETGSELLLYACLDGDVLLGASTNTGDPAEVVLFVRAGNSLTPAALTGTTSFSGVTANTEDARDGGGPSRMEFAVQSVKARHSNNRNLAIDPPVGTNFGFDGQGNPVSSSEEGEGLTATYTLGRDGTYRTSFGVAGAVTRRKDLVFFAGLVEQSLLFFAGIPGEDFAVPQPAKR